MALSKNYLPNETEQQWYAHWTGQGYFHSEPDGRPPFTIVIPPPNVTGVLHMGHTLNETVQDILVRRARMQGYNACWVPGSDHASIATEARVVAMLEEKGVKKTDISREEFLEYAFQWKEKYGGIIYQQIKKLGCSCDWDRVTFTMDDHYYKAVVKTFVTLYNKGLIYRGARMIHWDPAAQTALSDEEVEYREVSSKLYYVRYPLEGTDEFITIATTRPETIPGDTAICINPTDARYRHLAGKFALVPLVNRRIPIITDEYVDKEFGTGCLKVTPAHDINDYNLGLKHKLEVVDVFNPDGTMSAAAQVYPGEDRFVVRGKIADELREKGFLVKEEALVNKNGFSQRTNAIVEPRISTQWFLKMEELAKPALDAVLNQDVKLYPEGRFQNTYRYWMENIKDWCISRQLWWGQRIPAWYDEAGNTYVAETEEEARKLATGAALHSAGELHQDEDVLDTWFSSWLWPMEVFKGISEPGNKDIEYYYPTSVLVTGQDILFFWVARMIMAGMEFKGEKPFDHVYFTGMVRDKLGRKMSKSLGNSPDLLELIDHYGADAVRFGILIASPAGNDLLFDESSLQQGRNFCNKMWNALKLVQNWEVVDKEPGPGDDFATGWFSHKLNEAEALTGALYENYRLSEVLKLLYSLIWDDFCSWYLEWVKPGFETPVAAGIRDKTISFFERLLQLLHPFMPFVTEEIYHRLRDREAGDDLMVSQTGESQAFDQSILDEGGMARKVITAIRDVRNKNQLKNKDTVTLHIHTIRPERYKAFESILQKQVNTEALHFTAEPVPGSAAIVVDNDKIFIEMSQDTDTSLQKDKLLQDLEHQKGFLASVEKKLGNERFVQHAKPELVDRERKKQSDAEARIRAIEESLKAL
ncbi:MAG TPA: valine--tRNA ligase [Chitinophagaceae bacterium]|nr:valine--tRNA ligase [Chitinophagaceae bacterium]